MPCPESQMAVKGPATESWPFESMFEILYVGLSEEKQKSQGY